MLLLLFAGSGIPVPVIAGVRAYAVVSFAVAGGAGLSVSRTSVSAGSLAAGGGAGVSLAAQTGAVDALDVTTHAQPSEE